MYTDAETGFVYLQARYYDPATGQFITRDPIEAIAREAYGYVRANPSNATDSSGLCGGPRCWAKSVYGQVVKQVARVGAALTGYAGGAPAKLTLTPCSVFCIGVAVGLNVASDSVDGVAALEGLNRHG